VGEAGRVSRRKLRLFAAALCEKWRKLPLGELAQAFLSAYERDDPTGTHVADTPYGVAALGYNVAAAIADHNRRDSVAAPCRDAIEEDRWEWGLGGPPDPLWQSTRRSVEAEYPALLREIVGNPFRPRPYLDAGCLAWNDGAIPKIARWIDNHRAFDRLPV